MSAPTTAPPIAPLFVALTVHTEAMIESVGGESILLDRCTVDSVRGRDVIIVPSAAKMGGTEYAKRKLRQMGASRIAVVPALPNGSLDLADHIEQSQLTGQEVNLEQIATMALAETTLDVASDAISVDCTVSLICGSDLTPERIRWLWPDWLARGKLHMIAGAPGTGKTTLALALGATVTAGGRWPDATCAEVGNVLIWSGEDDIRDTLLPRLLAMGADKTRVYFVGDLQAGGKARPFDPARDIQALIQEAANIGDVRLIIVDPVVNAVSGDSHKNTEVRHSLQPLVDLAARLDATVLGVSHFSKGTAGRDPVERVTGSVAFGALPRVVFGTATATDAEGRTQRLFARAKSNIGPDGGGFSYTLEQAAVPGATALSASRVKWGKPLDGTARELLAIAETTEGQEERRALADVKDWLRDLLNEEGGAVDKREIIRLARDNGFSERTIYRARDKLGVHVRTTGFGKDKRSVWSIQVPILPTLPTKDAGNYGRIGGTDDKNETIEAADWEAF